MFRRIILQNVIKKRAIESKALLIHKRQLVSNNNSLQKYLHKRLNLVNAQYENFTGISEIRKIQERVLDAEFNFVEITKKRRSCQDKIDELKNKLATIKDKLENTPRSSDNYIRLITSEHELLREQLSLDAQLEQLKENEQLAFDLMSKLLRQSHECERLRQDRSKYWSVITLVLSFACSCLAIIGQKVRSQNTVKASVLSLELKMDEKLDNLNERLDLLDERLNARFMSLEHRFDVKNEKTKQADKASWYHYVPGLTTLTSWFVYKGNEM